MHDFFLYPEIQCIYDSEVVLHWRREAGSCVRVHRSTQATPTLTARRGSPRQCGSGLEPTPGDISERGHRVTVQFNVKD